MTADTPRALAALSRAAPIEIVPHRVGATRIVTAPAPQTLTLIPDRRVTRGLVIRASRISGPSRFA